MLAPQAQLLVYRSGYDANPTASRSYSTLLGRLVQKAFGDEFGLAVAQLASHVKIVIDFLGHRPGATPCSHRRNTGHEEKKASLGGINREFHQVPHSANVWLKGRESPIEVHGPLVV